MLAVSGSLRGLVDKILSTASSLGLEYHSKSLYIRYYADGRFARPATILMAAPGNHRSGGGPIPRLFGPVGRSTCRS
jgi:hypothetical protein